MDYPLGDERRSWGRRNVEWDVGSFTHTVSTTEAETQPQDREEWNKEQSGLPPRAKLTQIAHDIRKSNSLRGGGQWQTIALLELERSAVRVHLMRTPSELSPRNNNVRIGVSNVSAPSPPLQRIF
jgi:hypothetical protein